MTSRRQPIAIVGVGCRFPGAVGPDAFWELLTEGRDAIREVPPDRWDHRALSDPDPTRLAKIRSRRGGFIDRIDHFDAGFFGISPREALRMDVQQRLLLEVAFEALEDAGQSLESLAGSSTGVFIGISTHDYGQLQVAPSERLLVDAHTNAGGALSITANRISYSFDLRGPSLAVDTACSSSLVAVHLAAQSLWRGEASLALVGGVNAILKPEVSIGFSRGGFLSPEGRCRSFDAAADGYVRSEGAGVILLKPLDRALGDGDRIYAVLRGSAVNQDGRTEALAVPSEEAQTRMLRAAYEDAGIDPHDVQYVEAHGTGTPVGDPIEARAIGAVLGAGRDRDRPCLIGSVKTNLGHLEAGAGIAALIKTALALRHARIPSSLHCDRPNPAIPWDALRLQVATELQRWPDGERRVAGVNGFGFGGTNAHVVLEGPPAPTAPVPTRDHGPCLLPLSARSPEALAAMVDAYRRVLDPAGAPRGVRMTHAVLHASSEHPPLDRLCAAASLRRSHHPVRLAAVGRTHEELRQRLAAFAGGDAPAGVFASAGHARKKERVAFVFSGQGPQWWGMGRELLRSEPGFRASIEACDALFRPLAGWSVLDEMTVDEARSRVGETAYAQPMIFALQVGLAALWRARGVEPAAVVGHSVGEVAAAHVAGALSLAQAVRVIFHRARVQQKASGTGLMLAAGLSESDGRALLAGRETRVSLAAINGPEQITFSGDAEEIRAIAARLEADGVFHRLLEVRVPFHSPFMDPLHDELVDALADLRPSAATIPLTSTVTGQRLEGTELDGAYWFRNVRDPVRFAPAIEDLLRSGVDAFVEIGPHPVLKASVADLIAKSGSDGVAVASLRRHHDEQDTLLEALADLYVAGVDVAWSRAQPTAFLDLPRYPWQRQRYWLESDASRTARCGPPLHPLFSAETDAAGTWVFEVDLSQPYLDAHRILGSIVFPGAAHVEMALAAAHRAFPDRVCALEHVDFTKMLIVPDDVRDAATVRLSMGPDGAFRIASRTSAPDDGLGAAVDAEPWALHSSGQLAEGGLLRSKPVSLDEARARCTVEMPIDALHAELHAAGLELGPAFRSLRSLHGHQEPGGEAEVVAEIEVHPSLLGDLDRYYLHPAIIDACFQSFMAAAHLRRRGDERFGVYVARRVDQMVLHRRPSGGSLSCYSRVWASAGKKNVIGAIWIFDADGTLLAEIRRFHGQYLEGTRGDDANEVYRSLYQDRWLLEDRHDQLVDRKPATFVAHPSDLALAADAAARQIHDEPVQREYYDRFEPEADALVVAHIAVALSKLGVTWEAGRRLSPAELPTLGITPRYGRLLARLFHHLAHAGFLQVDGDGWVVSHSPSERDPAALHRELVRRFPAFSAELTLIDRCAPHLAEVLRGTQDPVALLFQDRWDEIASMYADSFTFSKYNRIARAAVEGIVRTLPAGQTLRVLEIGAGTGGTTAALLPVLPEAQTTYVFTDVSPMFLDRARERFEAFPFVRYERLDIEQDVAGQGILPHTFDLVIASNVLHATASLRDTLRQVRQLLAPGGTVLLVEVTEAPRWADLVFGLTEGWWRFGDVDLRTDQPLLTHDRWAHLLAEEGFVDTHAVSDRDEPGRFRQHVLLSRGPVFEPEPHPITLPGAERGAWLLLADRGGVAAALSDHLGSLEQTVIRVEAPDPGTDLEQRTVQRLAEALAALRDSGVAPCGVVHLWSLDGADPTPSPEWLEAAQHTMSTSVLALVRGLLEADFGEGVALPQLWLVTAATQAVGDSDPPTALAAAGLWGLGRVLSREHPELSPRLIDLGARPSYTELRSLVRELCGAGGSEEVALRGPRRYVQRMVRPNPERARAAAIRQVPAGTRPFGLEPGDTGLLDSLAFRTATRRPPGAGEVEIAVTAAAINFRDVMTTLGLLPKEVLAQGFFRGRLGGECTGRIVAVGAGVGAHRVGDEVIAVASHCFASHVTTPARYVLPKPAALDAEQAAGVLIVYATAWYALKHLARAQPGERVLVHAAAGGVGIAAIHVARHLGLEVYATAGSNEKRDFVRSLGVRQVMDSRSLGFAEELLDRTDGAGVDVVINSLSGPFVHQSVACLAPHGRFIEIGKVDMFRNTRLGLSPFQSGLSYFGLDLDLIFQQRPETGEALLREVGALLASGALPPLPTKVFRLAEVVDAFRYVAQARQIGKVAIRVADEPVPMAPPDEVSEIVRPDGTYLISGGLGGFGLAVAEWLVAHGARHLVLLGRSGARSEEALAGLVRIRGAGVNVLAAEADVADATRLEGVLVDARRRMPPVRGVVHAAMVLDDAAFRAIDHARLMRVVRPKVFGAWNLHQLTRDEPLDFFVSFGSLAAIFGNPGQANYASANTFLDAFAHWRRGQGLPATTIDWGMISEVGFVARNDRYAEGFARLGLTGLTRKQALDGLGRALLDDLVQAAVTTMDWDKLGSQTTGSRFAGLGGRRAGEAAAPGGSLRAALAEASPEKAMELLQAALREQLGRALGTPADKVDLRTPLTQLGLDSLMANQLRAWILARLGLNVSIVSLVRGPTVTELTRSILEDRSR